MTGIDSWSTTPANNATADGGSINWAEGQPPSSVNNTARQMLADIRARNNDLIWFQYGTGDQGAGNLAVPSVYSSGTAFTIAGADVTVPYHAGRRVKAVGSSTGTIYGTISSSSYSSGNTTTTVNVTWDSGSLSNETLTIYLGQLPVTGMATGTGKVVLAVSPTVTGTLAAAAITASGTITPSQTNGIVGTTTNNDANAGSVGEFIEATVASASAVAFSAGSGNGQNVTSISLTAGDWDVTGNIGTTAGPNSNAQGGIHTTSATQPSTQYIVTLIGGAANQSIPVPRRRISIASTTTVYLVCTLFGGSTGSSSIYGYINARRVR